MADSSLDVFFAKKDKSKKSKSRKFANADPVGKAQDDGGGGKMSPKMKPKREKEKVTNSSTGSNSQNIIQDDDEWKDVEEKETDYTGLKIQNVQISDLRDEDYERSKSDEMQEDEQSRNKDGQGPWNRGGGAGVVEPVNEQIIPAEVVAAPKKDTKYVAPGMRENATPLPSKTKPKSAPQLSSEFDFPSLSASSDAKPAKKTEIAEQSKGKLSSQSSDLSNIRRPYAELASRSEMANQADSS